MTRHQLDNIMIDKAWRTSVMNSRTRPCVDCDTAHILVTMKLRMKVYKQDKPKKQVRYNLDKLKDPEIKSQFELTTHNQFTALLEDWTANETVSNESGKT